MTNEEMHWPDPEAEARKLGLWLPPDGTEIADIGEAAAANWRDFPEITTDSLWFIGSRSRAATHNSSYHGNFVPQIPFQAIRRFTRPGEVVFDPFLGSGTTLIEARRLGRHGLGIELNPEIARLADERIQAGDNPHATWQAVIVGDSARPTAVEQARRRLSAQGQNQVQLLMMHPPYHDIIQFSQNPQDLSNAQTLSDFLAGFKQVVLNTAPLLEMNRFLVVVIGDKYTQGEWVPLGFQTMEVVRSAGYTLKSIVVKNMEGNRAKRNLQNFWRQRAFKGNYYIFKHEYLFFFQKTGLAGSLQRLVERVGELDRREGFNLIKKQSLVSGEALAEQLTLPVWLSPARLLALKHRTLRALILDLQGMSLTRPMLLDLERFLAGRPETVVDVAALADREQRSSLQAVTGLSQCYDPQEADLSHLAHTLYAIRKAAGGPPRRRRTGIAGLAQQLATSFQAHFPPKSVADWQQQPGGRFHFWRRESGRPLGDWDRGTDNFQVCLEIDWGEGDEFSQLDGLRRRYFNRAFTLVALLGPDVSRWQALIGQAGHCADYYLLLDKAGTRDLAALLATRPLLKAVGQSELVETDTALIDFLKARR